MDDRATPPHDLDIALALHALRTSAGLSQRALAARVGTTASAISRIERADYRGHSLGMLRRVAGAVGMRVEVRFVKTLTDGGMTMLMPGIASRDEAYRIAHRPSGLASKTCRTIRAASTR